MFLSTAMLICSKLSSFVISEKEYTLLEKVMGELFPLLLYCLNVISILIPSNQIDLLVSYRDNN